MNSLYNEPSREVWRKNATYLTSFKTLVREDFSLTLKPCRCLWWFLPLARPPCRTGCTRPTATSPGMGSRGRSGYLYVHGPEVFLRGYSDSSYGCWMHGTSHIKKKSNYLSVITTIECMPESLTAVHMAASFSCYLPLLLWRWIAFSPPPSVMVWILPCNFSTSAVMRDSFSWKKKKKDTLHTQSIAEVTITPKGQNRSKYIKDYRKKNNNFYIYSNETKLVLSETDVHCWLEYFRHGQYLILPEHNYFLLLQRRIRVVAQIQQKILHLFFFSFPVFQYPPP